MEQVQYTVPLDRLYHVVASCQYQEGSDFCPVLVKIIDPFIVQKNEGCEFLLQVWSIRGDLIFEKPMNYPVANWNISGNVLTYLE